MTDTKQPDALYEAACRIAKAHPSLAFVTRMLRGLGHDIGYIEAVQLLERMIAAGVISDYAGRKKASTEAALRARIAELEAQLAAIGAGGVTGLRKDHSVDANKMILTQAHRAAIEPDMFWIADADEDGPHESLFAAAADLAERACPTGSRIEGKIMRAKSLPSITLAAWHDENEEIQCEIVDAAIAQEGGK